MLRIKSKFLLPAYKNLLARHIIIPGAYNYCGASWLSGIVRDVQARDRGFDPWLRRMCSDDVVLLGKAL